MWKSTNVARNGKGHPMLVAVKIRAYAHKIVQYCFKPSSAKRCESSSAPVWTPPPAGLVCINVNAAIFSAEHRAGLGDHSGFAAKASLVPPPFQI
jgi:hypothetical protein